MGASGAAAWASASSAWKLKVTMLAARRSSIHVGWACRRRGHVGGGVAGGGWVAVGTGEEECGEVG